jgi:hypothetical protein
MLVLYDGCLDGDSQLQCCLVEEDWNVWEFWECGGNIGDTVCRSIGSEYDDRLLVLPSLTVPHSAQAFRLYRSVGYIDTPACYIFTQCSHVLEYSE